MDGSLFQYPMGAIYAYGGPFYEWLTEEKGEEAISVFYKRHGSRIPLFSLDRSAREAFGERFPALIADWQASVRESATSYVPADSAARKLTSEGWYISEGVTSDGEKLYYARTYGRKPAALYGKFYIDIVALDPKTGREEVIARPLTSINPPLRVHDGVLYYGASVNRPGFPNTSGSSYGELVELRALNLGARKESRIFEGRLRAFDRMPDGSLLFSLDREDAEFGSALLKIPQDGDPQVLWKGDTLVGEILASDEGKVYFAARRQGENWDIYQFSLSDRTWINLTNTPWAESGLALDNEGSLLYSANPYSTDARSGSYRLDPKTRSVEEFKTPSYSQNPIMAQDKLFFVGLNPKGYDIYSVEPSLSPVAFPSTLDQSPTEPPWDGEFKPRSSCSPYLTLLRPWVRIPYVIPTLRDPLSGDWTLTHLPVGLYLIGADVLGENSYNVTVDYDVVGNAPSAGLSWSNTRFGPLSLNLNLNMNPVWSSADSLMGYNYTIYPSFLIPLVGRQGRGLQSGSWGEGFWLSGELLESRSLESSLGASFVWPYVSFTTSLWHSWSSPIFSSYEASFLGNRSVAALDLAGGILIGDVSTTLNLSADQEGDTMYAVVRGYVSLRTGDGFIQAATLEYRHRILKMRFGIWNPNIFFEDLYANIFIDAAYDSHSLLGASLGLELSPQMHLIWGLVPLAPRLGIALTKELKPRVVFGLNFNIPLDALRNSKDALRFIKSPGLDLNQRCLTST